MDIMTWFLVGLQLLICGILVTVAYQLGVTDGRLATLRESRDILRGLLRNLGMKPVIPASSTPAPTTPPALRIVRNP